MKRSMWVCVVSMVGLLVPAAGFAQQISCARGGLQRAVDLYIEAQTKGDTAGPQRRTDAAKFTEAACSPAEGGLPSKAWAAGVFDAQVEGRLIRTRSGLAVDADTLDRKARALARVKRYRTDKNASEADTIESVQRIHRRITGLDVDT